MLGNLATGDSYKQLVTKIKIASILRKENIQFVKSRNLSIHAVKTVLTLTQLNIDPLGRTLFPVGDSDGGDEGSDAAHLTVIFGSSAPDPSWSISDVICGNC